MTSLNYVHTFFVCVLVERVEVAPDGARKERHVLADDRLSIWWEESVAYSNCDCTTTYDTAPEVV